MEVEVEVEVEVEESKKVKRKWEPHAFIVAFTVLGRVAPGKGEFVQA